MKKITLLLFFLAYLFQSEIYAQNCQTITADVMMMDTGYVDICVGEPIDFSATALFPENDLFYHQEMDSCVFQWYFGDGHEATGQTVSYSYSEPGGYYVTLSITDQEGCTNSNDILIKVRVGGAVELAILPSDSFNACFGDTLIIEADYEHSILHNFNVQFANNDTFLLPDGIGEAYTSSILVNGFDNNQIISDDVELASICVTIEHSWMFDLEVILTCPDGTEIVLQNQEFIANEVFLGIPYELDDVNNGNPPIPGSGFKYCWVSGASNGTWTGYALENDPQTLPEGDYMPFESFNTFDGCPVNGTWELTILDRWSSDNGYVFDWSLNFFQQNTGSTESFTVEITNYEWDTGVFGEVVSESANTLETVLADFSENAFQFTLEDSWGCTTSYPISIMAFPDSMAACQPCDSLIANAGPDQISGCSFEVFELSCDGSTTGAAIEQTWYHESGQIIADECNTTVILPGVYILEVRSLATGCIARDTVNILEDFELPAIDAGPTAYLSCSSPTVQLGGPNADTSAHLGFAWYFNGVIFSNEPFPIVDQVGIYTLVVTDSMNFCAASQDVLVRDELLLELETNTSGCDVADGSASVVISPAISNPQVDWSTGDSGLEVSNLAQGWYSVTVTDDTCSVVENFYIDSDLSCKVQILGTVYNDNLDQNCEADALNPPVECVLFHLMPLDIYTFSDENGHYEFVVDPGNYTIEIMPQAYFELLCPDNPSFSVDLPDNGAIADGHDFFLKYTPGAYDLSVSATAEPAFANDLQTISLQICNEGDIAADAVFTFSLDTLLTEFFADPGYQEYDGATNTVTWNLGVIEAGDCQTIEINAYIPGDLGLGNELQYACAVGPTDLDINPSNNATAWTMIVFGAYDPNDKQIFTGSNQFGGPISVGDTVLHYQIRFQNVGNYPAHTVVIRDTLDPVLDVTTIQPGISSHDYRLEFEGQNVLIFNFEDINLPDSTNNEPESHGYVTYSIQLKENTPVGTQIHNSAAIYFDFNPPVITNSVWVNIEEQIVHVNELEDDGTRITLSPNPADDVLRVQYQLTSSGIVSANIRNAFGQKVQSLFSDVRQTTAAQSIEISLAELPAGVYYFNLETSTRQYVRKFVKMNGEE